MTYFVRGLRLVCLALIPYLAACNSDEGLSRVRPKIVTVPEAGTDLLFEEVILEPLQRGAGHCRN